MVCTFKQAQNDSLKNSGAEMKHPVVLVTYARPQHLKQVLSALRQNGVELLYVFIDGSKGRADAQRVQDVHHIVAGIQWTVPNIVASSTNLGLATSVTKAVDHVLARHETVILLEDDCVPGPYFSAYMEACLDLYRDDLDIMGVTGYTIPVPQTIRDCYSWDVYFSPRAGSWGWGTWRRAWDLHIRDIADVLQRTHDKGIDNTQGGTDVVTYANQVLRDGRDIWTPSWILSVYLAGGQYVYPTVSHIRNIGWDGSGAHCGKSERYATPMADTPSTRFPPGLVYDQAVVDNFRKYYK